MSMNFIARLRWLAIVVALTCDAAAAEERELFPSFEVHPQDGVGPTFKFSEALATSASPVVIAVAGRRLKRSDRQYRVSLQKHWLSVHLPEKMDIVLREQVLCEFRPSKDESRCDRYVFEGDGKTVDYYFYLDNWP